MTRGEAALYLRHAATAYMDAENERTHAVREARRAGVTWKAIGAECNMSRQAAWERWRHLEPPPTRWCIRDLGTWYVGQDDDRDVWTTVEDDAGVWLAREHAEGALRSLPRSVRATARVEAHRP